MGSERLSRALLTASDSLGQMAQMSWQKEQQAADAEREENMIRLRQKLSNDELDKRQGFEKENEATRFQNNLTVANTERGYRKEDSAEDRAFRSQIAGREEGMQRERWAREDIDRVERSGMSQISAIDERIMTLRDAIAKGEYLDTKEAEQEIAALRATRDTTSQSMRSRLADMGDPRYPEIKRDGPNGGPESRNGSGDALVRPPPEPPSKKREESKRAKPPRQIVAVEPEQPDTMAKYRDIPDNAEPFKGAKQAAAAAKSFVADVKSDFTKKAPTRQQQEISGLRDAVAALRDAQNRGAPVPESVRARLATLPDERLIGIGMKRSEIRALKSQGN